MVDGKPVRMSARTELTVAAIATAAITTTATLRYVRRSTGFFSGLASSRTFRMATAGYDERASTWWLARVRAECALSTLVETDRCVYC